MNLPAHINQKVLQYILIPMFILALFTPASAADIHIKAETVQYVGGEFRVDISIEGASNLYGLAFDLNYDPSTLTVVDSDPLKEGIQPKVTEGSLLNDNGQVTTLFKVALEDGVPGKLVIGLTRSGETDGVNVTPDTAFLSVFFRSAATGDVTLSFDNQGARGPASQEIIAGTWGELVLNIDQYDWKGDVNQDFVINLEDTMIILKAWTLKSQEDIHISSDINQDEKIGFEEAINAMNKEINSTP
ncbi:cohesin domain-containing protein [Desulfobacter latus]|uniref:Cohesin domain-containing protein n=1 Tax=Desulfobacter latus TaxID=2292 RepID=A0A850T124_9BACT|nr:cohesin domain-containing protein [Desulfobacter latus]NWH05403.1 hypothetical protein [Desulfobacter latus]